MNVDIEKIRSVKWDQKHRWELMFTPGPKGFDDWFPAIDMVIQHGQMSTYGISAPVEDINIPSRRGAKMISVNCYDSKGAIEAWYDEWFSKVIFQKSQTVETLDKCVRKLSYVRQNEWRDRSGAFDAEVFPMGELQIISDDSAQLRTIYMTFGVVKITPHNNG